MNKNLIADFIIFTVILTLVIIIPTAGSIKAAIDYTIGNVHDFNELAPDDYKKGQCIEGDLHFNYGCVVEEYTTKNGNRTSAENSYQYYLIPVDNVDYECYTIVKIPNEMFRAMNKLCNETYDFLYDETAPWPTPVYIQGTVENLDDDIKKYAYKSLLKEGFFENQAEIEEFVMPYIISCKSFDRNVKIAIGAVSIPLIAIIITIIVIIISVKKAKRQKEDDFYQPVTPYENINSNDFPDRNNEFDNYSYVPDDYNSHENND